jgi:hypothetical protein
MNANSDLPSDELVDEQWERTEPLPRTEQFHHVAPWKFLVMSLATFGLYEMYWCYRCWQYVERMGSRNIWPIARGLFCTIFFFFLAEEINNGLSISRTFRSVCLAFLYIALVAISYLEYPYWVMALATPLVMLPLVIDVDRLNREWGIVGSRYSRFGFGHIAIITLVGGTLLLFAISTKFADGPSVQVLDGSEVPSHVVETLREYELLAEDESEFMLYVSAEEERDHLFVDELLARWEEGRQPSNMADDTL